MYLHMLRTARYFFFPAFLALVLLSACGPDYAYKKEYALADEAWSYQDSLRFTFDVPDTNTIYNLYLDLEHRTNFPNQNIYVRIHTTFPSGDHLSEEVSLELAQGGRWEGDCNQQKCTVHIPIQTDAYFNQTGEHEFVIEQFMRRNPVEGIQSVGLRIEETGESRS